MSNSGSNNELSLLKDYQKKVDYCYSCLQQGKTEFLALLEKNTDFMDFSRQCEMYLFTMVHLIHSYIIIFSKSMDDRYSISNDTSLLEYYSNTNDIEPKNTILWHFMEFWNSPEVSFIRNASENIMYNGSITIFMELSTGEFVAYISEFCNKKYKIEGNISYQEIYKYGEVILDKVLGIFEMMVKEEEICLHCPSQENGST